MGPSSEKEWTRADMPSSSGIEQDEASTSGTSSGHYIEHIVTRLDTLAGVAIKYGVEVRALTLTMSSYCVGTTGTLLF